MTLDDKESPVEAQVQNVPLHFGDIMSSRETTLRLPSMFSPMERVLLTANGNVQRILSAFYNSTVSVEILKNIKTSQTEEATTFEREVNIICLNKVCCNARSTVVISDPNYLRLLLEQQVGIGQLFRYLSILPEFELIQVGRSPDTFWREYELRSAGVLCRIREEFPDKVFALQAVAETVQPNVGVVETPDS
ncbi:hypothetical protein HDU85_004565 [Gaertneriomyces sp. JEL0708]|nr:hypothetical protein HDU85_004565 [Gaertneriomyces sp. JEL0708]